LVLFVVTFLAFLTVPLLLFGVALVAFLLLRPRGDRTESSRSGASGRTVVTPSAGSAVAPGRFGSGPR
ncbi:hypothetical protein, partial [Nocardioides sp.]|uniref:hypothetical protein n=1 Tax=Nocardioides sp. TaxID=35761 RepID=UPI002B274B43